jgi:hypothetical protein
MGRLARMMIHQNMLSGEGFSLLCPGIATQEKIMRNVTSSLRDADA